MDAAPELAIGIDEGVRSPWHDGFANGADFSPGDIAPDRDTLRSEGEALAAQQRDAANTEIAQLGRQVHMLLEALRQQAVAESGGVRQGAQRAAQVSDYYGRALPWPTLGLVAVVAGAIGFIAARR